MGRKRVLAAAAIAALLVCASAWAQSRPGADAVQIAKGLRDSLVRVEFTVRYDKGQPPVGGGLTMRCPYCGSYHYNSNNSAEEAVDEDRPIAVSGYLIASDRVLTHDLVMHPRFIEKMQVMLGDESVGAKVAAYARNQQAMVLQLDRPLTHGRPLTFDAAHAGPYLMVNYSEQNGQWATQVSPLSLGSVLVFDEQPAFTPSTEQGLIVAEDGTPVGMTMSGELAPGDGWKGSPEKWEWVSASDLATLLDRTKAIAEAGVLHVRLDLRSPRVTDTDPYSSYYSSNSEADDATEIDALGLLIDDRRVLVLSLLKSATTARLERITVHMAGSSESGVSATFTGTLRDYGAFVATLDEPASGALTLSDRDVRSYREQLLAVADVTLQGENRVAYFEHDRLTSFEVGWKKNVYPHNIGPEQSQFLFDRDGVLVALPMVRRERLAETDRWSGNTPSLVSAQQMGQVLSDLDANIDPSNVPLSEEEENRVAWLGVIMQSMDSDLARQMGVAEVSHDGATGGLVTFVYPDSPAAAVGIEDGDVLLRVHAAELPTPVDVEVDESDEIGAMFPWARLDDLPEQYFDVIPSPWPKVSNAFNKKLTAIGFGTPIRLEYARDGQVQMADMQITQSPVHYDAAPQYKNEALGLTVRPLTYEVRRYFQKSESDPGVIVAHIEAGSKASVVGVKPFEIITAVNDVPVSTPDEFRAAIAGQTELRLSMLRMTRTRLVKITLDEPVEDGSDGGATDEDAREGDVMDGG